MIDWDGIPEEINYIAMDSDQQFFGHIERPMQHIGGYWESNHRVIKFPDLDLYIDMPWKISLHQRPGTWDGVLRRYDNVLLADGHQGYLDSSNAPDGLWDIMQEDGTPWTLFRSDKILAVNRTVVESVPKKKHTKNKKQIALPVEVHNDEPIDVNRAMAAIHDLCRGHQ